MSGIETMGTVTIWSFETAILTIPILILFVAFTIPFSVQYPLQVPCRVKIFGEKKKVS